MLIDQNDEYVLGASEDAQVFKPDDVLYQLALVPQVKEALRAVRQLDGYSYIESLLDRFLTEAAPYRDVDDPINSRFLDREWEEEHGKIYELRSLIAIGYYLSDPLWFESHVRGIIRELRQKRLARLQRSQIELAKQLEAGRVELYYQQSVALTER